MYSALLTRSRSTLFPADPDERAFLHGLDNRIEQFSGDAAEEAAVVRDAAGSRPVVSERVLEFLGDFIALKRESGTPIEQALYATLVPSTLVTRLLTQRPLMFMTAVDQFVLKGGFDGADAAGFDAIGTADERAPLHLASLLSYEEMQVSALIGASSSCHFINDGSRGNQGNQGGAYAAWERRGVYVGQVGCRFERHCRMEWEMMVVDPEQNTAANGYGDGGEGEGESRRAMLLRWAALYRLAEQRGRWALGGAPGHSAPRLLRGDASGAAAAAAAGPPLRNFPLHSDVAALWDADAPGARARWSLLRSGDGTSRRFFDLAAFHGRCRVIAGCFLLEANARAAAASARSSGEAASGKGRRRVTAYCHAVGLGLGVWQVALEQRYVLIDAYAAAVEECDLPYVSDIDFSWMQNRAGAPRSCGNAMAEEAPLTSTKFPANSVAFRFSTRNPAAKLTGADAGKLLVAQFAWDANAYVGNEFWKGMLSASGDPAAACCSTIAELFVPEINPNVATLRGTVQQRSASAIRSALSAGCLLSSGGDDGAAVPAAAAPAAMPLTSAPSMPAMPAMPAVPAMQAMPAMPAMPVMPAQGGGEDGGEASGHAGLLAGIAGFDKKGMQKAKKAKKAKKKKKKKTAKATTSRRRRTIFVSASKLSRAWNTIDATTLAESLFFFGSKRSWIFPASKADIKEAAAQHSSGGSALPGSAVSHRGYAYFDDEFKAIIRAKELRNEVCWLKPDDLVVSGMAGAWTPPNPGSYSRVSAWLASVPDPTREDCGNYAPLILDSATWRTMGEISEREVTLVQKLIETGGHDYNPVVSLLEHSNRSLDVVLHASTAVCAQSEIVGADARAAAMQRVEEEQAPAAAGES